MKNKTRVVLNLDAVIVAVTRHHPRILTVSAKQNLPAIPSGPLHREDATLERSLRGWIEEQTGIEVGYVEQLYTFGDIQRGLPGAPNNPRSISVAYLALITEEHPTTSSASWINWYELFPWEDHRNGIPDILTKHLRPALATWAGNNAERNERVITAFGSDNRWDGMRVLERYELLYEAGLVKETSTRDALPESISGVPMAFDHRRIASTALGRMRGKLTYRPVVFELLSDTFTLLTLQRTVEAIAGVPLHKQNFRRLVERTRLVEGTGQRTNSPAGRPAELFRFRSEVLLERPRTGIGVPYR